MLLFTLEINSEKYCSETFVKPQNAGDISPERFPTRQTISIQHDGWSRGRAVDANGAASV